MTVSNTSPLVENKTGNGVWTTIAVTPGQILQNSDGTHAIKVIKTTIADGTAVTLAETTDYTVTLDGTSPSTGTITIVAGAPSSAYRYTVLSNLTPKQEVNLQNGTIVDMEDIESALDRLTLYAHKQDEKLERAVVLAEDTLTRNLTIDSLSSQTGKVLRVNSTEDGFDYVDVADGISQATFDINALSEIDSVVTSTDKLPIYDVSTGLTKYVTPENLGIGGALSGYAGNIQQIQQTTLTDTQLISAAATGVWYDVVGFSVTLTPSNKNSTILIGGFLNECLSANQEHIYRVVEDNAMIDPIPNTTGLSTLGHFADQNYIAGITSLLPFTFQVPADNTKSRTYKVQVCFSSAIDTVRINRSSTDTDSNLFTRTASQIYAIEFLNPDNPVSEICKVFESVETEAFTSGAALTASALTRSPGKSNILTVRPISSSSYNILMANLRAFSSSGNLKGSVFKNQSALFSPTSSGNRLGITAQYGAATASVGGNNGISFYLTESLASDDTIEYDIRTSAAAAYVLNSNDAGHAANTTVRYVSNFIGLNFITGTNSTFKQYSSGTLATTETSSTTVSSPLTPALSATITPQSSSNSLLITVNLVVGMDFTSGGDSVIFTLTRDGTPIFVGDAAGSRTLATGILPLASDAVTNTVSFSCIVSATSTSAQTFGITLAPNLSSSRAIYINRSHTDTDTTSFIRGVSQISVIEIDPIA